MALKGTLKDFGIGDIFQLIAQQKKTGVLHLKSKDEEVEVFFVEGDIVRGASPRANPNELLGNTLIRAGLMAPEAVETALARQRITMQRLGDLLVEAGQLSQEHLREMTLLQTTEILYRLFTWGAGTYAFEPREIAPDQCAVEPLRAEAILMEGFRMVDEWPMVKKRITGPTLTFERVMALPPETPVVEKPPADDFDFNLGESPAPKEKVTTIGHHERTVYQLAERGVPVSRLVELSRLGEFETCKALFNLLEMGILKRAELSRRQAVLGPRDTVSVGFFADARTWAGGILSSALLAAIAVLAGVGAGRWAVNLTGRDNPFELEGEPVNEHAAERLLMPAQLDRLKSALEIYALERGEYPESLSRLLEANLAAPADLRYPWHDPYVYRRTESGFQILPPLE